jgi:hypothetical protein
MTSASSTPGSLHLDELACELVDPEGIEPELRLPHQGLARQLQHDPPEPRRELLALGGRGGHQPTENQA